MQSEESHFMYGDEPCVECANCKVHTSLSLPNKPLLSHISSFRLRETFDFSNSVD